MPTCLLAAIAFVAFVASAQATPGMSVSAGSSAFTYYVGDSISLGIGTYNYSSAPDGAYSFDSLTIVPSCGAFDDAAGYACTAPDPGVLTLNSTATGSLTDSCAGATFTVVPDDAALGSYLVTPTAPLNVPWHTTCALYVTGTVQKLPAVDVDQQAGVQTYVLSYGNVTSDQGTAGTAAGPGLSTYAPAKPGLTIAATGTSPGALTATATLSSGGTATGTLTFRRFAAGDPGCYMGAAATTVRTIDGDGEYVSDPFAAPSGVAASYSWTVTYSGDATHSVTSSECHDADSVVKPPTVETLGTDQRTSSGATLQATVFPKSLATTYHFEYGSTAAYGAHTDDVALAAGAGATAVSAAVTDLAYGETYHYRIVATNSDGTSNGADATWRALGPPAVVWASTSTTTTSATVYSVVHTHELDTTYHYEYGPTDQYGTQTAGITLGGTTQGSEADVTIGNLTPNTTYHFRIVASNSDGITSGPDRVLTTKATALPKVAATGLTAKAAPARDKTAPYKYTISGQLLRPSSVTAGRGCSGIVTVKLLRGTRLVARAPVKLTASCTYKANLSAGRLRGSGKLKVLASFGGNAALYPNAAATLYVRFH